MLLVVGLAFGVPMLSAYPNGRAGGAHPGVLRRHARGLAGGTSHGRRRKSPLPDGHPYTGASQRSPAATAARAGFRPVGTRTSLKGTVLALVVILGPAKRRRQQNIHISAKEPRQGLGISARSRRCNEFVLTLVNIM